MQLIQLIVFAGRGEFIGLSACRLSEIPRVRWTRRPTVHDGFRQERRRHRAEGQAALVKVNLAAQLLERVKQASPTFFENLVVDLLVAMATAVLTRMLRRWWEVLGMVGSTVSLRFLHRLDCGERQSPVDSRFFLCALHSAGRRDRVGASRASGLSQEASPEFGEGGAGLRCP